MSDLNENNRMTVEEAGETEQYFSFLSTVFLTLPDEAFVKSLANIDLAVQGSEGAAAIAAYAAEIAERDASEVLLDLGRDRARLVRGAGMDAPNPPYETIYANAAGTDALASLNRFYRETGYAKSDDVHDAPDQIGVEFAFLAELFARIGEALSAGDEGRADELSKQTELFTSQHLGRWAADYGRIMADAAKTGFYRGIGLLIEETFR